MANVTEMLIGNSTANITENPPQCVEAIAAYWGYISAAISVIFFGLMYTPVKKFETGDGLFFQWIQCNGACLVGLALQLILGEPTFEPLAVTGGIAWVTGNLCVVPIFKTVGMSAGFCIWGLVNLISGWATGRFGLFGVNSEPPDNEAMSYSAVGVAIISAVIFATINAEINPHAEDNITINVDKIDTSDVKIDLGKNNYGTVDLTKEKKKSFLERIPKIQQRIIGIILCICSGIAYSQTFTPEIYIQEHYENASKNNLDYVFATFCGVYLSGTAYFIIYIIIKRNKPIVYPRVILPGIISGMMWGVATGSWFITNRSLSEPVAFTIDSTLPPAIGALIGGFIFKEITSKQNRIKLFLGLLTAALSAVLSALSKKAQPAY